MVTEGGKKFRHALSTPKLQKSTPFGRVQFRKDTAFVVWDERGLSIRVGSKLLQTRGEPWLWDKTLQSSGQIIENRSLTVTGNLSPRANHCVASRRIGDLVFLVLRFVGSGGMDHRDFLVSINLANSSPNIKPIARLDTPYWNPYGPSESIAIVGDRLVWLESGLGRWGAAAYDLKSRQIKRTKRPAQLVQVVRSGPTLIGFVEAYPAQVRTVGRCDLKSLSCRNLAEINGETVLLDATEPLVCLSNDNGRFTLHNLSTGSRLMRDMPSGVARMGKHLVLWQGSSSPTSATLINPVRWTTVAEWKAPASKAATAQKPTVKQPKTDPGKPKPSSNSRPNSMP